MRPGLLIRLEDLDGERANRNHRERIDELQQQPAVRARFVENLALADGVKTTIPHGLGRAPIWVKESCIRGASSTGRIEEVRDGSDRSQTIVLLATGWGATITIDLMVV